MCGLVAILDPDLVTNGIAVIVTSCYLKETVEKRASPEYPFSILAPNKECLHDLSSLLKCGKNGEDAAGEPTQDEGIAERKIKKAAIAR
jgi:hypothetical protein